MSNTNGSANSSSSFDFLWNPGESAPAGMKLPEGGNVGGLAGQWTCQIVYRFWTGERLDDYGVLPDGKRTTESGTFCYFHDYETALVAAKKLNQEYPPNTVWRWEIPTANILNLSDEARGKFGDVMTQEVTVSTLMSKKSRHELHMITLPSAVQAMALVAGFINETVFDYESLRIDPDHIDSAYQTETIGGEGGYENSKLWLARVALWKALGEDNPKAYTLNQGKFDATAANLRACLNLIYRKTQVWARLVSVPDPRADAVTKSDKHLQLPVITQIWRDKADMMRDLELEERQPILSAASAVPNGLKLPEAWAQYPEDWKGTVREITAPFVGKPKPIVEQGLRARADELKNSYGATVEDFMRWMDVAATAA